MLKLSKTTSPNKLFDNDCVTRCIDYAVILVVYNFHLRAQKSAIILYTYVQDILKKAEMANLGVVLITVLATLLYFLLQ